jgi:putative ABC transport system ATP-binding protein
MIVCKEISKTYRMGDTDLRVLNKVSLTIKKGEFIAIKGPSGSGKSTLMHILGLLDKPDAGSYHFEDQNILKLSDNELAEIRSKKIGFVFQAFNLLSRSSVIHNVTLPLLYDNTIPLGKRWGLVEKALESVSLEKSRWDHLSNQLSGGQMQRVAIARALVNNPSLILADEPTGNLDSHTGEKILKTFRDLNEKQGHTLVLITHDAYIAKHADRIIEIRDGAIISDKKH